MNFLFEIDNQAKLVAFAFFLAFFLFGIGITQFCSAALQPAGS